VSEGQERTGGAAAKDGDIVMPPLKADGGSISTIP
jgi:hypothetical protein